MSTAFRRVPFLFNTNISKLFSTLLYFMIGILSWQLDLALAVDPVPPGAPGLEQAGSGTTKSPPGTSSSPTTAKSVIASGANDTSSQDDGQFDFYDKSMLRRSFFVLIGFTCLAVVFFAVRWFR